MNARTAASLAAALTLSVAAPVALGAAPQGGAKYAGTTSDGSPVIVRLNGNASRVKRMRISYMVTCDDGRTGNTYTDILNPRLRSDHSFAASGTYTGSGDGSQNTFKVAGKLYAKRASGTFSLVATSTTGGATVHCRTGNLSWSAKRTK